MNYEAPPEFADKIINMYIWFAVTPCVYIFTCQESLFLENCLSLFYYRGVDYRMFDGDFTVLKRTVLLFKTTWAGGKEN